VLAQARQGPMTHGVCVTIAAIALQKAAQASDEKSL